jgi:hypothetical protein
MEVDGRLGGGDALTVVSAWDLKQGLKTVFSFKAHDLSVSQMELKISRDTRQLITSSWDGDVAWWNV